MELSMLSDFIYNIFKHQISINVSSIKEKLKDWVIDEALISKLVKEVEKLSLNEDMSERAIERKLSQSNEIQQILSSIKPINSTAITQNHSGTGDNIAGNKIIK